MEFLSLQDVLMIHQNQVNLYGGDPGIRDLNLLRSAIAQPCATFAGEFLHPSPHEMAAAYLFHIVKDHPFVDGNKRAGAASALIFLDLNGIDIEAPLGALAELTISVASGKSEKIAIANFFRDHSTT